MNRSFKQFLAEAFSYVYTNVQGIPDENQSGDWEFIPVQGDTKNQKYIFNGPLKSAKQRFIRKFIQNNHKNPKGTINVELVPEKSTVDSPEYKKFRSNMADLLDV